MITIAEKNERAMILIMLGIFMTPYFIRDKLFPSNFYPINFLSWLGIFMLIKINYLKGSIIYFKSKKWEIAAYFILINLLIIFFILGNENGFEIKELLKMIISIFLPMIVLNIRFSDVYTIESIYPSTLKIINYSVYFMVICGVIDILTNFKATIFFVNLYGVPSLQGMLNSGRIVSYMGHSLLTTQIFLIYYILNYINCTFCTQKNSNMYLSLIISLMGIALCGSKTGILLLLILFFILNSNFKMIKYLPLMIISIYILYRFGILSTVVERFIHGYSIGDLTTGRNSSLIELYQSQMLEFKIFAGHASSAMQTNKMIAALEYPGLRWAYKYGIAFSFTMMILLFGIPIFKICKARNLKLLLLLLIFIIDVNSFSGIAVTMDGMLIYTVTTFILLNVSYYAIRKGKC